MVGKLILMLAFLLLFLHNLSFKMSHEKRRVWRKTDIPILNSWYKSDEDICGFIYSFDFLSRDIPSEPNDYFLSIAKNGSGTSEQVIYQRWLNEKLIFCLEEELTLSNEPISHFCLDENSKDATQFIFQRSSSDCQIKETTDNFQIVRTSLCIPADHQKRLLEVLINFQEVFKHLESIYNFDQVDRQFLAIKYFFSCLSEKFVRLFNNTSYYFLFVKLEPFNQYGKQLQLLRKFLGINCNQCYREYQESSCQGIKFRQPSKVDSFYEVIKFFVTKITIDIDLWETINPLLTSKSIVDTQFYWLNNECCNTKIGTKDGKPIGKKSRGRESHSKIYDKK